MAHGEVKHDYHLVNPSPWPLIGSVAVMTTVSCTGAVVGEAVAGREAVGALVLLAGVALGLPKSER